MQANLVGESDIEMYTAFHGDPRVDMYCNCKGEVKSSLVQRSFYKTKDVGGFGVALVYVYVEEDEQSPGGSNVDILFGPVGRKTDWGKGVAVYAM